MKHNLGVVLRFEFFQQIHKKSFRITTGILLAAICFLVAAPVLFHSYFESPDGSGNYEQAGNPEDHADHSPFPGGVVYEDSAYRDLLPFAGEHVYANEEQLIQAVEDGTEPVGFVILDSTHIRTIFANYSLNSSSEVSGLLSAMQEIHTTQQLQKLGVPAQEYMAIQNDAVQNEEVILGKDTTSQYITGFVFIMLVYMVVLIYGQFAAVSVAREKDSKTMELLITTTRPDALILGKVFAVIAVVLLSLALYLGCAAIFFLLLKGLYPAALLAFLSANVSTSMLGVYLLYFTLALILYMFLFASLGSTVSKVEDVSSAVAPVTFLMIFGYALAFPAMSGTDNLFIRIASWIPFFSVLLMPIRFANAAASLPVILLSTVVNAAFTAWLAYISIRIYRWGALTYGNKRNFVGILKEVFAKK